MIKSISVTNFRDETILLELDNPYGHGLVVESVTGLGPAKANINTTELATSDGSIYNSARVTSRNIVITFRFLPDSETQLIETVRQRTYKYFPLKKPITLTVETDHRIGVIQGYVESNEPDIFQKEEKAQVSIVCPSPYFYVPDSTITLNGVESSFYFPFSNESLTEDHLIFGNIVSSISTEYIYDGDIDSGVIFHIHTVDNVEDILLYNMATRERMNITTGVIGSITNDGNEHLISGDDVYLSTISGDRYIYLVRGGKQYNILPALPKMTDWIRIIKGSNVFGYTANFGKSDTIIEVFTNVLYEGM